ncbi:hypothetical protein LOTGIDRAFT_159038 [Lottia gigantea]|uniref:tRNA-splicing endonuclease subunit Sen15 domain-containing protein n=1 Tax=Lottia gigantea TaxID=225164 RepID=V4A306_LOTGI|nr:hypothetical protein LOTGIDRAFT_159038 [Lottia gigantea]ESO98243.1 hypothetical protein LOTGIDRAFT_159038 [Lottia gigantea]
MESHTLPTEHPIYHEIQSYHLENPGQGDHAFQVYIDLSETRGWYGLKLHYCNELNCVFLSGKSPIIKGRQIVLPVTTNETLSQRDMQKYFELLAKDESDIREITLALCDVDSTLVYYKISNHIVRPEDPMDTELKKKKKYERFRNAQSDLPHYVDQYYHEQK